jgi:hypothetical protein
MKRRVVTMPLVSQARSTAVAVATSRARVMRIARVVKAAIMSKLLLLGLTLWAALGQGCSEPDPGCADLEYPNVDGTYVAQHVVVTQNGEETVVDQYELVLDQIGPVIVFSGVPAYPVDSTTYILDSRRSHSFYGTGGIGPYYIQTYSGVGTVKEADITVSVDYYDETGTHVDRAVVRWQFLGLVKVRD